jgi:hypothetical protein
VNQLGAGLVVTGRSPDDLIEAIELPSRDDDDVRFFLGVQWHPEDTAATDPAQQALFDALANVAQRHGVKAEQGPAEARLRASSRRRSNVEGKTAVTREVEAERRARVRTRSRRSARRPAP